jgi:hypothetical protein
VAKRRERQAAVRPTAAAFQRHTGLIIAPSGRDHPDAGDGDVHETHHLYRIIHMDAKHPRAWSHVHGHSIGHWEGDTLVVDTIGLTTMTQIDELARCIRTHCTWWSIKIDGSTLRTLPLIPRHFQKPGMHDALNRAGDLAVRVCVRRTTQCADASGELRRPERAPQRLRLLLFAGLAVVAGVAAAAKAVPQFLA